MNNERLIAENTQLFNTNSGLVKDLQLASYESSRKTMLASQIVLKLQELEDNYLDVREKYTIADTPFKIKSTQRF